MSDWLGKLKQTIKTAQEFGESQSQQNNQTTETKAAGNPNNSAPVTRIDLKTASHEELVTFLKRQNKHIQQLETLIEKYEAKHKEYKTQLSQYQSQLSLFQQSEDGSSSINSASAQIQSLILEKEALAADLQTALQSNSQSVSNHSTLVEEISLLNTKLDHLQGEKIASEAKLLKVISQMEQESREQLSKIQKLNMQYNQLDSKSQEQATKMDKLQSQAAAAEALKSRFQSLASQNQQFQQDIHHYKTNIEELQRSISSLKLQLEESQLKNSSTKELIEHSNPIAPEFSSPSHFESPPSNIGNTDTGSHSQSDTNHPSNATDIASEAIRPAPSLDSIQSDPLSNPFHDHIRALETKLLQKDEKIVSLKTLLAKVHKHIGELTASLEESKASIAATQAENIELRTQLDELQRNYKTKFDDVVSAAVDTELQLKISRFLVEQQSMASAHADELVKQEQKYADLLEEFSQFKMTVQNQSSISATAPVIPSSITHKLEELTSTVQLLQTANAQLLTMNESQTLQLKEYENLKSKHEILLSRLEKRESRSASKKQSSSHNSGLDNQDSSTSNPPASEQLKQLEEVADPTERMEAEYRTKISKLETELETSLQLSSTQLSKMKRKHEEVVQQKDIEIAALKDTVQVLKLQGFSKGQISDFHSTSTQPTIVTNDLHANGFSRTPSSSHLLSSVVPAHSSETPSTSLSSNSSSSNLLQLLSSSSSHSTMPTTPARDSTIGAESNPDQIALLLNRINTLTDQLRDCEQHLALSREQERFLKFELRRYDRSFAADEVSTQIPSSDSASSALPLSTTTHNAQMDQIKAVVMSMLITREIPSIKLFADVLGLTNDEIDSIQTRQKSHAEANSYGLVQGFNAFWNAWGTPNRS